MVKVAIIPPFFTYDFGELIGHVTFRDHSDAMSFLNRQIDYWQWLVESPVRDSSASHLGQIVSQLNHCRNLIAKLKDTPSSDNERDTRNAFDSIFGTTIRLHSASPRANFIKSLRERSGDIVAAHALSIFFGSVNNTTTKEFMRGSFEALAFDRGLSSAKLSVVVDELSGARDEYATIRNKLEKDSNDLSARARQIELDTEEKIDSLSQAVIQRVEAAINENSEAFRIASNQNVEAHANSIAGLTKVQETYTQFMQLQAPVQYWTAKAEEHRHLANKRRNWFLSFSAFAFAAVCFSLWLIYDKASIAVNDEKLAPYKFALLAAAGLFITTCALWGARILMKLFLSEHHLANDARERATMVQTYLAMSQEDKISKEDRTLILTPLFRSSADGIVRDDASVDLGLASVISKALGKS